VIDEFAAHVIDEYTVHGIEGSISGTGIPLTSDSGKKKILLLKGKQREIPKVGLIICFHFPSPVPCSCPFHLLI